MKGQVPNSKEYLCTTSVNLDGFCSTATFYSASAGKKILSQNKKLRKLDAEVLLYT